MPTISMRLSKGLNKKLGPKKRKRLGDGLRERLATALEIPATKITTYWDPWQDAQNPNDVEAEVHHKVLADKLPATSAPLLALLCGSRDFPAGLKVGVWFPLSAGTKTYIEGVTNPPKGKAKTKVKKPKKG